MSDILHSHWRITGGYGVLIHQFGDQYAVYHRGSGDTHLLHEESVFLLSALNQSSLSFEELLEKLCAEYGMDDSDRPQQFLTAAIMEFEKLAIIERLDK